MPEPLSGFIELVLLLLEGIIDKPPDIFLWKFGKSSSPSEIDARYTIVETHPLGTESRASLVDLCAVK